MIDDLEIEDVDYCSQLRGDVGLPKNRYHNSFHPSSSHHLDLPILNYKK